MDEAVHVPSGKVYAAAAFAKLVPVRLEECHQQLACTGCGARAYFVAKRRNGSSYFFGARPHNGNCELATTAVGETSLGDLPDAPERALRENVIRLAPHRTRTEFTHVEHDPDADSHDGRARRYVGDGGPGRSTRTVEFGLLLRKLIRDRAFGERGERRPDSQTSW